MTGSVTYLFNSWGIGDRQRNDGVLLLVAVKDRKVRIEVGSRCWAAGRATTWVGELQELAFRRENPHGGKLRAES